MRKKIVIIAVCVGLLALSVPAAAQDRPLLIWQALAPEDSDGLVAAADAFGLGAFEVVYIEPPLLYDQLAAASAAGEGPDIIVADNDAMQPLIDMGLIEPLPFGDPFFLGDLLNNWPGLAAQYCGDGDLASCLWPDVFPILPLAGADDQAAERAADWMCASSEWLAFCRGGQNVGVPISWGFNLYLMNGSWLAENGLGLPGSADGLQELRGEFGLAFVTAERGFIPLADEADYPPVYLMPSGVIAEDPDGVMRSLGSFFEAGYAPVLEMRVDAAYLSSAAPNADLAREFVVFMRDSGIAQTQMMESSQRFPAFGADGMMPLMGDETGAAVLRGLALLTSYAAQAY
jgi:hypothetical protein